MEKIKNKQMAYHQIPIITYQLIKSEIYFGIRLSVWNIISFGKQNFSHIVSYNWYILP